MASSTSPSAWPSTPGTGNDTAHPSRRADRAARCRDERARGYRLLVRVVSAIALFDGGLRKGATLSDCGTYRYQLWREWQPDAPKAVFLMLNPSTADAMVDDPTIRKCVGFAKRWGMGGIIVVNLFAYRATDPTALAHLSTLVAVGPENSEQIRGATHAGKLVCAWGATGGARVQKMVRERLIVVKRILREAGVDTFCLGRSADGSPRHPLMLAYSTPLDLWSAS